MLAMPLHLTAQVYLGDDADFFEKKARLYQRWLDVKGLGAMIEVEKVELAKNDMELELFLLLRTSDPDMAASLWRALQKEMEEDGGLEENLYNTFSRFMEIPPAQGNVQVYIQNEGKTDYNPCFYIWIWQEENEIQIKDRIDNCKAQVLEIPVKLPAITSPTQEAEIPIGAKGNRADVFDRILQYARQRYEQEKEGCEERSPEVEETDINNEYVLTFVVSDLCREVLTDEQQSLWCDFVELWWGDCNDMRRERLEFTFYYTPTEDGYLLTGSLTGKFGSGVYKPRISGYMDMEPDFEDDFLVPYVRRFQQSLKQYLENQ